MRPVEARYEEGVLKPAEPLPLRSGERVGVVVTRLPDPKRWDLARLAQASPEEQELSSAGLADWASRLDREDRD
jgi:predicted DNA-binding antitoxin AbrB/MazE fold protein